MTQENQENFLEAPALHPKLQELSCRHLKVKWQKPQKGRQHQTLIQEVDFLDVPVVITHLDCSNVLSEKILEAILPHSASWLIKGTRGRW